MGQVVANHYWVLRLKFPIRAAHSAPPELLLRIAEGWVCLRCMKQVEVDGSLGGEECQGAPP